MRNQSYRQTRNFIPSYFQGLRFLIVAFSFGLFFVSCSPWEGSQIPKYTLPQKTYSQPPSQSIVYSDPGRWWESLGLAPLNNYMEQSLAQNLSLKAARARLDQKIAMEQSAFAGLFPELNLDLSNTTSTSQSSGDSNINSVGLSLSYDVDLFGKKASSYNIAQLGLLIAFEDYKQQLSNHALAAAKLWLQLAEAQSSLQLSKESLFADQANLQLIQNSFQLGVASFTDVLQAQEQKIYTQVQIIQQEKLLFSLRQNLRILTALYPNDQAAGKQHKPVALLQLQLPTAQPGVPSELMQRRPDIRMAFLGLKTQDEQIAIAVANRYPRITLSASGGTQSGSAAGVPFSNSSFTSLYTGLTQPIFDFGKRKAAVTRQKAVFQEQLANYQLSILNAVKEVEGLLFAISSSREKIQLYQKQATIGKERLKLTKQGFIEGSKLWSYVLSSQSQYFTAQRNLLAAKREWLEAQMNLYAALGGSWMKDSIAKQHKKKQPKETL